MNNFSVVKTVSFSAALILSLHVGVSLREKINNF